MSISFIPYRQGANGGWTCPLNNQDELPNYTTATAVRLLDDLGFGSEDMWEADPVPLDLFEQAVVLARAGMDGSLSPATEARVVPGRGPIWIEVGQREGRDNERLEELLAMVKAGRSAGATHVGWG
jgi:hypothetical protein